MYGPEGTIDGAKGSKRKAPGSAVEDPSEQYVSIDWQALGGRSGGLEGLTLDKLKLYLHFHRLPVSGKKADVCARIRNHMGASDV